MKKAVVITAYNRPKYFEEVINSWGRVRGLEDWSIRLVLEPSGHAQGQAIAFCKVFSGLCDFDFSINPTKYGVLHNPWVAMEDLFAKEDFDFVLRGEDDLVVSADILEYTNWAAEEFVNDSKVAAVLGYTDEAGEDPAEARLVPGFGPWVFGTWQDRWQGLIGPTWDHDYSTFNGSQGNQSGWDWNLNTRIYPQHGLLSVVPTRSRVHNIGVSGTHAVPQDYHTSQSFEADHGPQEYRLVPPKVDG